MCCPEVAVLMGDVPVVPYATTGTPALGDAVEPFLEAHEAVLLANHGAVAWGGRSQRHVSAWKAWSTRPGSSWPPAASAGSFG